MRLPILVLLAILLTQVASWRINPSNTFTIGDSRLLQSLLTIPREILCRHFPQLCNLIPVPNPGPGPFTRPAPFTRLNPNPGPVPNPGPGPNPGPVPGPTAPDPTPPGPFTGPVTTRPFPLPAMLTGSAGTCNRTCECGKRPLVSNNVRAGFEERIVGGMEAERHSHPWLARIILYRGGRMGPTVCGGTLLNKKFVLTAAHCVERVGPFAVVLGDHDQVVDHGVEFLSRVIKVRMHKDYDKSRSDNDIALLELQHTVRYQDHIQPACIPSSFSDPPAREAWAVGWGRLESTNKEKPDALLEVKIPLISREECRKKTKYAPHQITENMICGGIEGKDTCQGDSGGPLVIAKGSHFEVQGVVSWGVGCGAFGYPGVYAKVFNYIKWMQEIMGTNCINCL